MEDDDWDFPEPKSNLPSRTTGKDLELPYDPYIPIHRNSTEEETIDSDLNMTNNILSLADAMLRETKTIAGLCMISGVVCKQIEVRRKVKKLPWGPQGKSGKSWETLE